MSELQKMLDVATKNFREKVANEIVDRTFEKICRGATREITISNNEIVGHLNKVCPRRINADEFVQHFKDLEPYVQFSSSVESFAKLSKMHFTIKKQIPYLDKRQVDELRKSGARLHTLREKNDMVFDSRQRGVQFAKGYARGLIRTIGSKSGQYEDKFSPDGFFLYEPPCQPSGMLRFRWTQFLKQKYDIPIFFILVKWFGLLSPIHDVTQRQQHQAQKGKLAFMIIPVTVVTSKVQKENRNFFSRGRGRSSDLRNLGRSIERSLPLQMIEPEECFQTIIDLDIMGGDSLKFEDRPSLKRFPDIARDYDYDALTTPKGGKKQLEKQLERWAKNTGKRCPDGQSCVNKRFDDPTIGKLHLGHIISKDWCKAFKLGERFQNHPYNLYLTCGRCNRALSKFFPYEELQKKLDEEKATIGDWAIQFDSAIRNTRI